jgi:hypothetical protein
VSGLHAAPGVRVAPPLLPGGGGRPASRRRLALGLALLVLAALGALVATGSIGLPEAGSATAAPARQASQRAGSTGAERERAPAPLGPPEPRPTSDRVVAPTHVAALFARHSWYVAPPPKPPPPPPPPPEPRAPPFPYTFVGSFAPAGDPPVYFLKRGDRVIDAHVGDKLDGVYQLESAARGQLVFVYLPLDVRQTLAAGAPR